MIRNLIFKSALIATLLSAWGCAVPQKGHLPTAELPAAPLADEFKSSVSFTISFLPPPSAETEQKLVEEFLQEFEGSKLFRMISPAPAAADIHMAVVLTQAVAVTSKQFTLYLATGGLSPINVPCIYDLHAEIRRCSGKDVKYDIKDEISKRVWAPGWPPGVDWGIDPTSSSERRNLYRTLMMQMHGDGLLHRCEE
jgi:hypothetical protein